MKENILITLSILLTSFSCSFLVFRYVDSNETLNYWGNKKLNENFWLHPENTNVESFEIGEVINGEVNFVNHQIDGTEVGVFTEGGKEVQKIFLLPGKTTENLYIKYENNQIKKVGPNTLKVNLTPGVGLYVELVRTAGREGYNYIKYARIEL